MLATPDLLWLGQCLPAASAPALGPHTSYGSAALAALTWRRLSLDCSAADCSVVFSLTGWASLSLDARSKFIETSRFSLAAPGLSMGHLYVAYRRHSAATILWYDRNPYYVQAVIAPPGSRPPTPGSRLRRTLSVAGGPFVSSGRVAHSSIFIDFWQSNSSSRKPGL